MKLAIIDLDGVAANREAVFALAAQRKEQDLANGIPERTATDLYWRVVFDPEHVPLDTLIDGVKEALETLRYDQQYILIFLTSRPESMRVATIQWLFEQNILFYLTDGKVALVMKPSAFQYTKTVVWKAGMVQTLSALYGASQVLVVDDEDANIQAVKSTDFSCPVQLTAKSLAEAVAKLNGTWVEPDPFAPEFGAE